MNYLRKLYSLVLFIVISLVSMSQGILTKEPGGGGNYRSNAAIADEITPAQRTAIISMLKNNETSLRSQGLLPQRFNPAATLFEWPLKQALGSNDRGYYGISNYIDQNLSYPNLLLDYNCGNRTYDQASGYNHKGTDIFTWPFSWQKMQRNGVEIIAAAPGVIIGKSDGNFDQNCTFCSSACDWNALYVMHADGSIAWYGHMKSGSLTTKLVGNTVTAGEYLGVVGSSGNSTGPHLHFEVYTNSTYTQLVDPWAGNCNSMNGLTSWWASQEPYYVPTLNKVMTHGAAPATANCPVGEQANEKVNFTSGQTIYFGSYYRDQQNGQQAVHTVYRPDNSVYSSWAQNFTTYYSASWWYYFITLPNPAPDGTWRYEILYNTKKTTQRFAMNTAAIGVCNGSITPLFSNLSGASYQWQEDNGGGFTNISDNSLYEGTGTSRIQLKQIPSVYYGYQYRCLVNGNSYSNSISLKFETYWTGYKNNRWDEPANWSCGNIPDANTDVIVESGATSYPEVNVNAFCRTLTTATGATVTVKPGVNLTIVK
ncbi:MAG: M23 family metallopeptidase [Rhizobacter sp.]|nr:M23 family metallopeptidase [Ferruginibacter sp.]